MLYHADYDEKYKAVMLAEKGRTFQEEETRRFKASSHVGK
jgi:hypothetical protein